MDFHAIPPLQTQCVSKKHLQKIKIDVTQSIVLFRIYVMWSSYLIARTSCLFSFLHHWIFLEPNTVHLDTNAFAPDPAHLSSREQPTHYTCLQEIPLSDCQVEVMLTRGGVLAQTAVKGHAVLKKEESWCLFLKFSFWKKMHHKLSKMWKLVCFFLNSKQTVKNILKAFSPPDFCFRLGNNE